MKKLDKMSRTVGYLEKIYGKLNERFFESALTMPIITVQSTPNAYGHISVGKVWEKGEERTFELNIGAGTLKRPIEEICATMAHEMSHQWNIVHGIEDCSRGGTYHNRKFKECAEKRGLRIEKHDYYGWTITYPTDEMIEFCIEENLAEILINRSEFPSFVPKGVDKGGSAVGVSTGKVKKPSSTRKYQCPSCKNSVRATKCVNILCMDCLKQMQIVD